jgi:hypothetical protein
MENFEADTGDIVGLFVAGRISFMNCVRGLDAALSGVIPVLTPDELPKLQRVMQANKETVMAAIQMQAQVFSTNSSSNSSSNDGRRSRRKTRPVLRAKTA